MVSCLSPVGTGAGGSAKGSFSRRNLCAPGRGRPAPPGPACGQRGEAEPLAKACDVSSPATCLSCPLLGGRGSSLLQTPDPRLPRAPGRPHRDAGPCGRGRGPLPDEVQCLHRPRSSWAGDEEPATVPGTQGTLPPRPGQGSAGQLTLAVTTQAGGALAGVPGPPGPAGAGEEPANEAEAAEGEGSFQGVDSGSESGGSTTTDPTAAQVPTEVAPLPSPCLGSSPPG